MSLLSIPSQWLFSRLISQRPAVRKQGQQLIAVSDWRSQLWSLGFGGRKMIVDPAQKTVRIYFRSFWFARSSRRLEFDWIDEVIYGYQGYASGLWAYQEADLFSVGFRLKNGEELVAFRFFGEGDFVNNSILPDWMYWEEELTARITRGDQENESLLFAETLSGLIGVPIGNPVRS